jgi:hypothetical protein
MASTGEKLLDKVLQAVMGSQNLFLDTGMFGLAHPSADA